MKHNPQELVAQLRSLKFESIVGHQKSIEDDTRVSETNKLFELNQAMGFKPSNLIIDKEDLGSNSSVVIYLENKSVLSSPTIKNLESVNL